LREPTIARNYAEALFQSGERSGETERYADLLEAIAGAISADDRIRVVLDSPRVTKDRKHQLLADALQGRAPEPLVRFLSAVIKRGRQGLIPDIAREYLALLDISQNRVHAGVVVAREPDKKTQQEIARRLSEVFGKTVVPHFREEPAILGGLIVRVGDTVMDGSLRRKLLALRRQMLGA
jgi:F-type H+-transporting ATPase subunit delta